MDMRRDAVPCARLSLTHNDFHTENILVEDDGRMVVIDWPNFRISDYRFDLGWALMLAGTYASRAASDAVLQTYEAVRGAPVAHIDVFIVAAIGRRLSDLAVTVKGSAAERGMRPDAVNNMRHVADHFEACYGWLVEITGVRLAGIEDLLANLGE
jgi:aminoglycoside phosphotransferase (APT) family kinase protein